MLGIMVGVTRRTVTVGIPQVQFSDLVVVPGVPDSAAPCIVTTSGTVGLRAEQIILKEYVDSTLEGLDDFCFFSGESIAVVSSPRSWAQLPVPIAPIAVGHARPRLVRTRQVF